MTGDYSVGQVADLAHVSVRTLHHYDEVGLLSPSSRTAAGHRRYTAGDLQRLRTILFYRELEFGLDEIAAMLVDPGDSVDDHLRNQHRLLRERRDRDARLLAALEKEMESREMGIALSPEEQFEIFGTTKFGDEYADEAKERWGDTEAWRESQRRAATYTKDDWVAIKAETDANVAGFVAAISAGEPADGERARQLAEDHRQQICRWFYDCSPDMHAGIGELYVSDPRWIAEWEGTAPGFSQYVRDAIVANAASRAG